MKLDKLWIVYEPLPSSNVEELWGGVELPDELPHQLSQHKDRTYSLHDSAESAKQHAVNLVLARDVSALVGDGRLREARDRLNQELPPQACILSAELDDLVEHGMTVHIRTAASNLLTALAAHK